MKNLKPNVLCNLIVWGVFFYQQYALSLNAVMEYSSMVVMEYALFSKSSFVELIRDCQC